MDVPLENAIPPFNNEIYLEGRCTIYNNEVYYMTDIKGPENWMRDNALNFALDLLNTEHDCEANRIVILNSNDAQMAFGVHGPGDIAGNEQLQNLCQDKDFIIVPINSGIGGTGSAGFSGTHWTFIVIDQIRKIVHHFDSLVNKSSKFGKLERAVSEGILVLLGQDQATMKRDYKFWQEWNVPHQTRNNDDKTDTGACGPAVFKMADIIVWYIREKQRNSQADTINLHLDKNFPKHYRFNSYEVRIDMMLRVMEAKRKEIAGRR